MSYSITANNFIVLRRKYLPLLFLLYHILHFNTCLWPKGKSSKII